MIIIRDSHGVVHTKENKDSLRRNHLLKEQERQRGMRNKQGEDTEP